MAKNKSPFGGRKSMVATHVKNTTAFAGDDQFKLTWRQNFSPTILESKVPQRFVNIINDIGDKVLKDDGKK